MLFAPLSRQIFLDVLKLSFIKQFLPGIFMLPPKAFLDSLAQQASSLLSQDKPAAVEDLEQQLRALLQSAFTRLDLVSREEFESQALVLQRTRQRLEQLEQQVARLEEQLQQTG